MTEKKWKERATKKLVGRKIVSVEWLSEEQTRKSGWYSRPIVLVLDNGGYILPMQDDEGNNGGALETSEGVWPVLSLNHDKMVSDVNAMKTEGV